MNKNAKQNFFDSFFEIILTLMIYICVYVFAEGIENNDLLAIILSSVGFCIIVSLIFITYARYRNKQKKEKKAISNDSSTIKEINNKQTVADILRNIDEYDEIL